MTAAGAFSATSSLLDFFGGVSRGNQICGAAASGRLDEVKSLIEGGLSVNEHGAKGSPLHEACRTGRQEVAAYLLHAGANVNDCDLTRDTPLHCAAWWQHDKICKLLIENGANLNAKEIFGNTPLHDACRNGSSLVLIHTLLTNGADKNIGNLLGEKPEDLATAKEAKALLKAYLDKSTPILDALARLVELGGGSVADGSLQQWQGTLESHGVQTLADMSKLRLDRDLDIGLPTDVMQGLWELHTEGVTCHAVRGFLEDAKARTATTVKLRDGRLLAYAQYGDLAGAPVLYLHGLCGSRIERPPDDSVATRMRVRLITVDRPGYGESDMTLENRSYPAWARDVQDLMAALDIDKFGVVGFSSGGPHALALAAAPELSGMLTGVVVASGDVPYTEIEDRDTELSELNQDMWQLATSTTGQWALIPVLHCSVWEPARDHPESFVEEYMHGAADADKLLASDQGFHDMLLASTLEGAKHGSSAAAAEVVMERHNWGFDLKSINVPVTFVYGDSDPDLTESLVRKYLINVVPKATLHVGIGEGHFSAMLRHWPKILAVAVGQEWGPDASRSAPAAQVLSRGWRSLQNKSILLGQSLKHTGEHSLRVLSGAE
mmetsp:Transcript_318/g.927  ORF Transcript_318/g.927 Transcript_318/m.927 type:complete len:607 (-) Transcript_318:21-1841(-)|eukprot:CAMPEP_0114540274 /NCGR_PEP_ID=MMETSP0114-20121206/675_1 /TAXON_ID=31324 /ORGANISM="Goniomonas sp, Strain m" /LENGTH=606 /DNA_ID=CAMNT_0001724415 /DNA_START=9 /DNA_END=1829 /DNA_ORIENTATION=+